MFIVGDAVKHDIGTGKIYRVDTWSYSIPMHFVRLLTGKHDGESICVHAGNIVKINEV